jgi:hypothetical protein
MIRSECVNSKQDDIQLLDLNRTQHGLEVLQGLIASYFFLGPGFQEEQKDEHRDQNEEKHSRNPYSFIHTHIFLL